jgi:hypothetical protein
MESNLQGEDIMERNRKKEIKAAKKIIAAIDHWLNLFKKGAIEQEVGCLIQDAAMRELAFVDFINDNFLGMDELRALANDKLEECGEIRIIKPIPAPTPHNWIAIPFPTHTVIPPKKTRREELEEYTEGQVREVYEKARAKDKKKYQINYILEAEKDCK